MKSFAALFQKIDQTNSTNEKVHLMEEYFLHEAPENSAWALYLLIGRRPKKLISSAKLRTWLSAFSSYPDWLLEESYSAVGDTAEMISLIMGNFGNVNSEESLRLRSLPLNDWMQKLILPLADLEEDKQKEIVIGWWQNLLPHEIFIVNKFLTGGLRVGVSEGLVYKSLEKVFSQPKSVMASRLLGSWTPSGEFFKSLGEPPDESLEAGAVKEALPKPFCLAAQLEGEPKDLGSPEDWQIEWKWDGIRCQIVKFDSQVEFWSRGEERITDGFPEMVDIFKDLKGNWILDGELVAGSWEVPAPFQELQKRINRKKPSVKYQNENPVAFIAYDLMVLDTQDLTQTPLLARRKLLEDKFKELPMSSFYGVSPLIEIKSWDEISDIQIQARLKGAEGLMLKKKDSIYETGRKRGVWFKWKLDPLTVDAVLTSAQPGTGRRASLYTDYTFSIWKDDKLVPIAKAYSGLSDAEIRELDQWIRKNTVERFGPVRALKPLKVFEIGFEGVAKSTRHKSGYAVRFPRILKERIDKTPETADHVKHMEELLSMLQERSP